MSFTSELAAAIRTGIERPVPHAGLVGPGAFGGSFDWHSCVHAHWALACMGRTLGRSDWRAYVDDRLTGPVLRSELSFLDTHPSFERPYGRAWLVLLLAELSRTRPDLVPLLDRIRAEMGEWLRSAAFPESEDGSLLATHDSWLFALFLLHLSAPHDRAFLDPLLEEKLVPQVDRIRAREYCDADFLDLAALLTTLTTLVRGEPAGLAFALRPAPGDSDPAAGSGHACGRAAVCLWPSAADAALGHPEAQEHFARALLEIEAEPDYWKYDFAAVSHWVPQFLWMALWLRDGCP